MGIVILLSKPVPFEYQNLFFAKIFSNIHLFEQKQSIFKKNNNNKYIHISNSFLRKNGFYENLIYLCVFRKIFTSDRLYCGPSTTPRVHWTIGI